MQVVDPKFPGIPQEDFSVMEEWYSLKDFSNDLHVLMVQETEGMSGAPYQRPAYPATCQARMYTARDASCVLYRNGTSRRRVDEPAISENAFRGNCLGCG